MAEKKKQIPEDFAAELAVAKTLVTGALLTHHETIRKYGVLIPVTDEDTVQDRLDSLVEKYK